MPDATMTRHVLSVSELTLRIKASLEKQFAFVWITGEVTNFRRPVSGHFYFALKDEQAQISAVMFRGQNQNLKFDLENGMAVTGLGRISVYEPRGAYQIILEYLEPHGVGALQVAFEQLKQRLGQEGYFSDAHKKELPFLPCKISLITSPTGAVVHDMQQTIHRRFANMPIQIYPVKVQGNLAIPEIVAALQAVNSRKDSDVIILARGGGSLEDLQAFNSEQVAKAIYSSEIPVISAIGHETDFTIADFVADVRAATPSVAAELATPLKIDLIRRCQELRRALSNRLTDHLQRLSANLKNATQRLVDPRHKMADMRFRIDELTERLIKNMENLRQVKRDHWAWKSETLYLNAPLNRINILKSNIYITYSNLQNILNNYYDKKRSAIDVLQARLQDLNPRAILARGYSITRCASGSIVRSAHDVAIGQSLQVILYKGHLGVTVDMKNSDKPGE
jgi:exodeoxyribonuclease VII large subunit